jgi:hypothetical protein
MKGLTFPICSLRRCSYPVTCIPRGPLPSMNHAKGTTTWPLNRGTSSSYLVRVFRRLSCHNVLIGCLVTVATLLPNSRLRRVRSRASRLTPTRTCAYHSVDNFSLLQSMNGILGSVLHVREPVVSFIALWVLRVPSLFIDVLSTTYIVLRHINYQYIPYVPCIILRKVTDCYRLCNTIVCREAG